MPLIVDAQNIYTEHYFESRNSPPLLALLGTTTPSVALREFINNRGPNFVLGYGATFSDTVLDQSYTSAYSQTAVLQGQSNSSSGPVHFPMHFYEPASSMSSASGIDALTGTSLRATLFLILATVLGFVLGTVVTLVMRRKGRGYGHSADVLQQEHERQEREFYESLGLGHLQRTKTKGSEARRQAGAGLGKGLSPVSRWMRSTRRAAERDRAGGREDETKDPDREAGERTPMIGSS